MRRIISKPAKVAVLATVGIFILGAGLCLAAEKPWWPVKVNSYYGTYDVKTKTAGRPAKSLTGPKVEDWVPPQKANKPYTIGCPSPFETLLLAVNYGIISEAKTSGVESACAAEGHTDLAGRSGGGNLSQQGVDGIILAATSMRA
jgi:protein TorT